MNLYKHLAFLFTGGLLFSSPCFSKEVSTLDFWLCQSERARGVAVRSLRIQKSKNKNHCLVIYTNQGREEILAENQWLSSCQKTLQNRKDTLANHLWNCEKQSPAHVFYPD